MTGTDDRVFRFGPYTADCRRRVLLRGGDPIELAPTAFDLLVTLLSDPGRVFPREELISRVWAGRHVEDGALSHYVSQLRHALDSRKDAYITTRPRLGYQFVADVVEETSASPGPPRIAEASTLAEDPHLGPGPTLRSRAPRALPRRATLLRLAATTAVALLVGSSVGAPRAVSTPRVVAVLPLEPIDSRDRMLGPTLAHGLAQELAKIPELVVRSAAPATVPNQDPVAIAASLGAEAALAGTITARTETVRVGLRLLAVPSGQVLWAGVVVRPTTDLGSLKESLAEEVSRSLRAHLSARRLREPSTTALPAAEQAYLKGRYNSLQVTAESFRRARRFYLEAMELDPSFVAPRVALASLTELEGYYGFGDRSSRESFQVARRMIEGILRDHPDEANALDVLGRLQEADWQIRAAEATYRRAVELETFEPRARQHLAWSLLTLGRVPEARREMRLAVEIDTSPLRSATAFAGMTWYCGEPQRAVQLFREVLDIDPRFARAHMGLGLALEDLGDYAAAEHHLELARDLLGDPREPLAGLGHLYAMTGRTALAKQTEAEIVRLRSAPDRVALVAVGLGDIDRAVTLVEAAVADRSIIPMDLLDRRFDPLRRHPRWLPLAAAARGDAPLPAHVQLAALREREDEGQRRQKN